LSKAKGFEMNTRKKLAAQFDVPKNGTGFSQAFSATPSHAYAKVDSRQEALRSPGFKLTEETEETEDLNLGSKRPTQAAQNESYNAKKLPCQAEGDIAKAPWKKAFWTSLVDEIETKLSSKGVFFLLRQGAWLDSLEREIAFIATESEYHCTLLARKASEPLAEVLSSTLKRNIRVRFVVGCQRIMEAALPESGLSLVYDASTKPEKAYGEDELAILHDKYGDIMGIVDNHPLFKKVQASRERGGWGIFPQLLTKKCKEYGVISVLTGLRFVVNNPRVKDPRAFFLHAIDNGQFGHRLAVSAPTIGKVNQ
jgi:hypothetical protein